MPATIAVAPIQRCSLMSLTLAAVCVWLRDRMYRPQHAASSAMTPLWGPMTGTKLLTERRLCDAQPPLHLFQRNPLRLGDHRCHPDELQDHHEREEQEDITG